MDALIILLFSIFLLTLFVSLHLYLQIKKKTQDNPSPQEKRLCIVCAITSFLSGTSTILLTMITLL